MTTWNRRGSFQLLGPVTARLDEQPLALGHPRQRSVLAVLLVEPNGPVPVPRLIDRVWGEQPPATGTELVYGYVSRLRRLLARMDDVRLLHRSSGYVLEVDPQAIDLHRFHRHLAEARGITDDDERAAGLLRAALGDWSGTPFADLSGRWFAGLRDTLERERVAATGDYHELRLRLGHQAEVLGELRELVKAHPLDERLAGLLLLALYRSGRQAEALSVFGETRRLLVEELGIEPGPDLRRLHQQILTADPVLAGSGRGLGDIRPPVPRQLPAAPPVFAGRAAELAALDGAARPGASVAILAIVGAGGVGKTWLALHWAHQNLELFADGQLYVNLRGFEPSGLPVPPVVVVRGFLEALGVPPAAMPADADSQLGLYRSLVAGRHLLIVLDDARDAAQVTPLLPGSSTCTVLVTSRTQLSGLVITQGATPVEVGMLTDAEARELLRRQLGPDRVGAEPDAVAELIRRCAGLPLALGIASARAARHRHFPLAVLAKEMRDESARLDAFDTGDLSADLRAVFATSYRALPFDAGLVFRLLGLAPGTDVGLPAIAVLTGLAANRARAVIRNLQNAHLIQEHLPGRYRMHDLVRLYAVERSQQADGEQVRRLALRRLVDFFVRTAYAADRLLAPHRRLIELGEPVDGVTPEPIADPQAALAWFAAEHAGLLAAQLIAAEQGWDSAVWQLAWALDTFHGRQGNRQDHLSTWRAGSAAADRIGDPATRALAHRRLGHAYSWAELHAEALDHLGQALAMAEHAGDDLGQTNAHYSLALAWERRGDLPRALRHASRTLSLARRLDDPVWQADALNAVGWYSARLGDHERARGLCDEALIHYRRLRDRDGEAITLDSLGMIAHQTGRHSQALDYYHQAIDLHRNLGNSYLESKSLTQLGQAYAALGRPSAARHAWDRALDLCLAQHRAEDARLIREQLVALDDQRGRPAAGPRADIVMNA